MTKKCINDIEITSVTIEREMINYYTLAGSNIPIPNLRTLVRFTGIIRNFNSSEIQDLLGENLKEIRTSGGILKNPVITSLSSDNSTVWNIEGVAEEYSRYVTIRIKYGKVITLPIEDYEKISKFKSPKDLTKREIEDILVADKI